MASYNFVTDWHISAPIELVWNAIVHSEDWPIWWDAVEEVVELQPGQPNGCGNVRQFTWRMPLAYTLTFETEVTRVEAPTLMEATAIGEVEGVGLWQLSPTPEGTHIRYTWTVQTTKQWMNLVAIAARPLLEWNHNAVMQQGGEGLAEYLHATLLSSDSADRISVPTYLTANS